MTTPFQRIAIAVAMLAAGCGGGDDDPDTEPCPIGDMSAAAEIEIVHLDAQNAMVRTQASATIPLLQPPQGGWIVLLGARARNIDGCRITLTTALIDACNDEILGIDRRPTKLIAGSDGWGSPEESTFGNLPVCPHLTTTRDLNDVPYIMQVLVEDADGRKAQTQVTVVPTCPAGMAQCNCQCARDYRLGSECTTVPPQATCPAPATRQ